MPAQPEGRPHEGEREGLSVFLRDGDRVLHSYSTYQRGLDPLLNTYNLLDLTPLGRQEEDGIMAWVRHHDRYGPDCQPADGQPAGGQSGGSCCEGEVGP